MTEPLQFSICVATHNRSALLPNFLKGLLRQTGPSFEVVVVVDGDSDDSAEVLRQLVGSLPLALRFDQIPHAGRGAALNQAFDLATGRFIIILDDDDRLADGALAEILASWNGIPEDERRHFCGVVGLAAREDGNLIGDEFPSAPVDSDFFTMRQIRNVRGDKKEAFLREALGDWRFPQIAGELRVSTNLLWFELASRYRARFVNRTWVVKNYLPDGLTANGLKNKVGSARLSALLHATALTKFPRMPPLLRLRTQIQYARFAAHAGIAADEVGAVLGVGLRAKVLRRYAEWQRGQDLRRLKLRAGSH